MSQNKHRLGVTEVNLVVRHLKLEPIMTAKVNAAINEVDQLYGVDGVSFNEKAQVLNLAYDASRLCIDDIEEVLKKYDIEISHDWWTHFKAVSYTHLTLPTIYSV